VGRPGGHRHRLPVLSLIDLDELRRYWAWRRTDALLAFAALVGVATTDVLLGLLIAVLLSLLMLLLRASRPEVALLGRLPGDRDLYADLARHPDAVGVPGILIARLDAPLYFFNASASRSEIMADVDAAPETRVVVLDMAATTDLDVTTSDMLQQLHDELAARRVRLVLAHAKGRVRDRLARTGLLAEVGRDAIYFSVAQAEALEQQRSTEAGPSAEGAAEALEA
jgi:sulfate permease, SulP family